MTTHCTATKPNGEPCQARPLPDRDVCFFHDPAHADTLAAARSKGGAAPRRRVRRVPRLMDHLHIAEVLGEVLIDTLNHPDETDTKRLLAVTRACALLLKAVGVPKGAHFAHPDHREPSPAADHLLRVYPPLPPEIEALLAAEPLDAPSSPEEDIPLLPFPESPTLEVLMDPADHPTPRRHSLAAPPPTPAHAAPTPEQDTEQDADRTWTGLSASRTSDPLAGATPTPFHTASPITRFAGTRPFTPSSPHPLIPLSHRLLERHRLRPHLEPPHAAFPPPIRHPGSLPG